jgi:hypothetical protein
MPASMLGHAAHVLAVACRPGKGRVLCASQLEGLSGRPLRCMSVVRRLLGIRLRVGGKNNRPSLTTPPARSARVRDASGGQFRCRSGTQRMVCASAQYSTMPGAAPISPAPRVASCHFSCLGDICTL